MGKLIEAVASIRQGKQANKLAKRNAAIDEADADLDIKDSQQRAAIEQRRGAAIQASQSVGFAGGGVLISSGTPLQLAAQEAVRADLRAGSQLRQGALSSQRRKQAADLTRFRGKAARTAGFIKGGTKLAEAAAQTFGGAGGGVK